MRVTPDSSDPNQETEKPSTDGDRRDPTTGRLLPGHRLNVGRESPDARKAVAWRHAFKAAVSTEDVTAVVLKLVEAAKNGERWAITDLLDRCIGPAGRASVEMNLVDIRAGIQKRIEIVTTASENPCNGQGQKDANPE